MLNYVQFYVTSSLRLSCCLGTHLASGHTKWNESPRAHRRSSELWRLESEVDVRVGPGRSLVGPPLSAWGAASFVTLLAKQNLDTVFTFHHFWKAKSSVDFFCENSTNVGLFLKESGVKQTFKKWVIPVIWAVDSRYDTKSTRGNKR